MGKQNLSLEEMKPLLPPWLYEMKKKAKEKRDSELLVEP